MLFKNSVRTSKRTPHFTITNINWLMLFKEIIAVYAENYTETKQNKTKWGPSARGYNWVTILVVLYDPYELRWGYSLSPATTRGKEASW
jgi:hypothetical protein